MTTSAIKFLNKFAYPHKKFIGKFLDRLLNNILFIKIKRRFFYLFTKTQLKSDIKNVVFLNWLVSIDKIAHLVPGDVKIKKYNDHVLLTVLTYKHGNFRPALFNKIKFIFGSPLQSNWRLYIENNELFEADAPTVFFVKNILNSFTYAVGSRVFSDILQSHLPNKFEHFINSSQIITKITPGLSNAPDIQTTLIPKSNWELSSNLKLTFSTAENLINTICKQEFAVSCQPDKKYSVAKINLKFNDSAIEPLEVVSFESEWLKNIVADSDCFAFVIKDLTFLTLGEKIITIKNNEHN